MGVLSVDEDAALTMLSQRVVSGKRADDASLDVLMQIDEAAKVLDEKDEEVLKGEQKKAAVDVATHDGPVKEWENKRRSTRGARTPASTAKGKKRGGQGGASSSSPTALPAKVLSFEQPYLETFMPPNS